MKQCKSKPGLLCKKRVIYLLITFLSLGSVNNVNAQLGNDAITVSGNAYLCSSSGSLPQIGGLVLNLFGNYDIRWYRSELNKNNWTEVYDGRDKTTFTVPDTNKSYRYYRKISSKHNESEVYTSNYVYVVLIMEESAGVIDGDQVISAGTIPKKIEGTEPSEHIQSYTIEWQYRYSSEPDISYSWKTITGEKTFNYQPPATNASTIYRRRTLTDCGVLYSNEVEITVNSNYNSDRITGSQTICHCSKPKTIKGNIVSIDGTTARYQWEYSTDGTYWNKGGKSANYEPTWDHEETTYYRRRVTIHSNSDDSIIQSLISNVITVEVYPAIHRGGVEIFLSNCYGKPIQPINVTDHVTGGKPPYSFLWQYSIDNNKWYNAENGNEEALSNPQEILYTKLYYKRITTDSNGCTAEANYHLIGNAGEIVNPGIIQNDYENICYNTKPSEIICTPQKNAILNPWENDTDHVLYQWEKSTDEENWSEIKGAESLNYSPSVLTQKTFFRRKLYGVVCVPFYSNTKTIDIYPSVIVGNTSPNQTICYNTRPSTLSITKGTGGNGTYAYQWQKKVNSTSWADILGANQQTYTPQPLTTTTHFRVKVTSCETAFSNTIMINVLDELNVGSISDDQQICFGERAETMSIGAAQGADGTFSYQWQKSTDNSNYEDIVNARSLSYINTAELNITTYYRVEVTNNTCGNTLYTSSMKVDVLNKLVSGSVSTNQNISYNTTPQRLTIEEATGGNNVFTYQWQRSTNGTSWTDITGQTGRVYQPSQLTNTTYYQVKINNSHCDKTFNSDIITVNVYDELLTGDLGEDQKICHNTTPARLTSNPSGGTGAYTYQWEQSNDGRFWTDIEGETNSEFVAPQLTSSVYYRVTVMDGKTSKTSLPVHITVLEHLSKGILNGDQTICNATVPEELVSSEVQGGSGSYYYQWQESPDKESWTNIIGANSPKYHPPSLEASVFYRLNVRDLTCNESQDYEDLKITVLQPIEEGDVSDDQNICYGAIGDNITIGEMTGGHEEYSYQWRYSQDGTSFNPMVGATKKDLHLPTLYTTTYYKRSTYNLCGETTSPIVTVNVSQQLTMGDISEPQEICFGDNPESLTCEGANGGIGKFTYQWKQSSDQMIWEDIKGATNLSHLPYEVNNKVLYRLIASNSCGVINSADTYIEVREELEASSIGSSQMVLYNSPPHPLNSTEPVTGGSGSYSFQWQISRDGASWRNIINGTQESYSPGPITQTTYFKRLTIDSECGTIISNVVQITVGDQTAVAGEIAMDHTICHGNTAQQLINSKQGIGISSQQWQKSTDGTEWEDIVGETNEKLEPGMLQETTYFRKKVFTARNGELFTNIVKVTVEQLLEPGNIIGDQEICLGTTPSTIITETAPNILSYKTKWEQSNDGSRWITLGQQTDDYLEVPPISESIYLRKVIETTCSTEYTNAVFIKVNQALSPGMVEYNQNIAYNTIPKALKGTLPTGGNGVYTYEWEKSLDGVSWAKIPKSDSINYQPERIRKTTLFRRLVSSSGCGTISSNEVTITVAAELFAGQIGNNETVCYGSIPSQISATGATGGIGIYSYIWERSTDGETWEELFGETEENLIPTQEIIQNNYYRRKVISGTAEAVSNTVRIDHLPEVITPEINYESRYCRGDQISINSNLSKILWYDENMNFISNQSTLNSIAEESIKYYYQIENNLGCKGDLKEIDITVDFVETDIETNAINNNSIENGERLTINPNVVSNFAPSELEYTWTFDNQNDGWYETMFDKTPSQYFHWKGWYNINLITKTPTGCRSTFNVDSAFHVNEETEDIREKSAFTGKKEPDTLDPNFGTNLSISIDVYPTIFDAAITADIKNIESKADLYIFDITGQSVRYQNIDNGKNLIPTPELAKGIYIIKITLKDGETIFNIKIIKK